MIKRLGASAAFILAASLIAGCAGPSGGGLATASIPEVPKVDPVCSQLASQIEALRAEGVSMKVENAAAKKYKMKPADLSKAAQLNKANEDFQARCATVPVRSAVPPIAPSGKAAGKAAAALPAAAPAAIGIAAQEPAKKELTAEQLARAADAAAARAAVKAGQPGNNLMTAGD